MSRIHRNYSMNLMTGANRGNQGVYKLTPFNSKSVWNIPVSELYSSPSYSAMPAGWDALSNSISGWWASHASVAVNYATWSDSKINLRYSVNAWSWVDAGTYDRQGNTEAEEDTIYAASSTSFPFPGNTYATINTGDPTQNDLPSSYNRLVNPASPPKQIYAPSSLVIPTNSDGHTVIVQPDGTYVDLYAPIELAYYSGDIVCLIYNVIDPSDTGHGWWMGNRASGIPALAGVIRDEETYDGADVNDGIAHALNIIAPAAHLDSSYSWNDPPAVCFDTNPGYSGTLPMGAHLAIDPGTTKPGSFNQPLGEHLWDTCVTYGMYITDRGGGGVSWITQPGSQHGHAKLTSYSSSLQGDLDTIMDNIEVVSEA